MVTGIFAGIAWAIETVILGAALGMSPFVSGEQAIFLAPFISTFLHDACSSLFAFLYTVCKSGIKSLTGIFRNRDCKWLIIASAIGGPVGMTGYVMTVNYMGASIGAVASAVYPAIGTVLACIFLKEKVKRYQWIFLIFTLLGLLGTLMCALGWGLEAVILAKCFKDPAIQSECALTVRQAVSALIYGCIILPLTGGWHFTATLFTGSSKAVLPVIAAAALFATVSYLFYYKAIAKVGAAKAMALNITYTAWTLVFTVIFLGDCSAVNPRTLLCAAVVVICGILAAADVKKLFSLQKN